MMLGQLPSEYTEYGVPAGTGYAEYGAEHGHNEFKANGKRAHHGKQARRDRLAIERDRAAALEAVRRDLVLAMASLSIHTGTRAVVRAFTEATR